MRIYLSGPMTGLPDNNYPAFNEAARILRGRGYTVVNPAENIMPGDSTWEDFLRIDIQQMLDCDAVAVLDDWNDSRGSRMEVQIAKTLGMPAKDVTAYPVWGGPHACPADLDVADVIDLTDPLSPYQDIDQNLEILAEECAEVIQIKSKITRFGIDDYHPKNGAPNRQALERELGHLQFMISTLLNTKVITEEGLTEGRLHKATKMPKWYRQRMAPAHVPAGAADCDTVIPGEMVTPKARKFGCYTIEQTLSRTGLTLQELRDDGMIGFPSQTAD